MRRISLFLILLFTVFLPASAFAKESPFNVDVFFGWSGYYRPMEWTPVEIGITADLKEPFAGSAIMSAKQDGLNTLNIRHDFVLTPGTPVYMPLVTKFAFNSENCKVKLIDTSRGREVWEEVYRLWDYSKQNMQFKAVKQNDFLIGLIGEYKFGLSEIEKNARCVIKDDKTEFNQSGKVFVGRKRPRMAPWDWTGYASLDMLILYDPDWSLFRPQQLKAIAQWVSKGGKLIVVAGNNHIGYENPVRSLLTFDVPDPQEVTLSTDDLKALKLNASEQEKIIARPLPVAQDSSCTFISSKTGFGSVTVIPFDPATLSARQNANAAKFWVNCIEHTSQVNDREFAVPEETKNKNNRRRNRNNMHQQSMSSVRMVELVENDKNQNQNNYNRHQYMTGLASAGSNAVMEYLYNISEMRPLGIWPVIFLLLLLAVLVGPFDYIVLKRKGILPLTWVTSAFWIIVFSFGAYHGVQALRGGSLQMRTVTVIDGIKGTNQAWSTSYTGIFAPKSDDYKFKDNRKNQWYSAIAPAEQYMYGYNSQTMTKQVYCYQHDGSNKPYSLPVNIWTMQCLLNESPANRMPLNASFDRDGKEVKLSIDNYSASKIKSGYIMFGKNMIYEFKEIDGRSSKDFTGLLKRVNAKNWDIDVQHLNGSYSSSNKNFTESQLQTEKVFSARGCLERSRAMKNYLKGSAAVVCVEYEDAPTPFTLENKSCEYKHIQLVRLVVFPAAGEKEVAYDTN